MYLASALAALSVLMFTNIARIAVTAKGAIRYEVTVICPRGQRFSDRCRYGHVNRHMALGHVDAS